MEAPLDRLVSEIQAPTPGRVVLYRGAGLSAPLPAVVIRHHGAGCVNLVVLDDVHHRPASSVPSVRCAGETLEDLDRYVAAQGQGWIYPPRSGETIQIQRELPTAAGG